MPEEKRERANPKPATNEDLAGGRLLANEQAPEKTKTSSDEDVGREPDGG